MIFVALSEAAERGELILMEGGLCRWHRRRDGVVVIREIIVLPEHRRKGIGREMIRLVRERNPGAILQAKCPEQYESNAFWGRIGFALVSQKGGINLWQRDPSV